MSSLPSCLAGVAIGRPCCRSSPGETARPSAGGRTYWIRSSLPRPNVTCNATSSDTARTRTPLGSERTRRPPRGLLRRPRVCVCFVASERDSNDATRHHRRRPGPPLRGIVGCRKLGASHGRPRRGRSGSADDRWDRAPPSLTDCHVQREAGAHGLVVLRIVHASRKRSTDAIRVGTDRCPGDDHRPHFEAGSRRCRPATRTPRRLAAAAYASPAKRVPRNPSNPGRRLVDGDLGVAGQEAQESENWPCQGKALSAVEHPPRVASDTPLTPRGVVMQSPSRTNPVGTRPRPSLAVP
jgi:hypothetical protein